MFGVDGQRADKQQLQVKEGIDAVIVDSVLAIRRGLTESDAADAAKAAQ